MNRSIIFSTSGTNEFGISFAGSNDNIYTGEGAFGKDMEGWDRATAQEWYNDVYKAARFGAIKRYEDSEKIANQEQLKDTDWQNYIYP